MNAAQQLPTRALAASPSEEGLGGGLSGACAPSGETRAAIVQSVAVKGVKGNRPDLDPAEAETVRAHLESCEACREEHEGLLAVVSVVREIPAPTAPEGFRDEVMAGLGRRRRN